jgi:hypothetical protein
MQRVHINDIAGALIVSVVLEVLWSGSTNHKLFLRAMQKIRITKKFGDENVWDFALNSNMPNVEYAYVRDFEKKIV